MSDNGMVPQKNLSTLGCCTPSGLALYSGNIHVPMGRDITVHVYTCIKPFLDIHTLCKFTLTGTPASRSLHMGQPPRCGIFISVFGCTMNPV